MYSNNYKLPLLFESISHMLRAFTLVAKLSDLLSPGVWPLWDIPLDNKQQPSLASEIQKTEKDSAVPFPQGPINKIGVACWFSFPPLCLSPPGVGKATERSQQTYTLSTQRD